MFDQTIPADHVHTDGQPGDAPPNGDFGKAAGDKDQPFTFGRIPTTQWPVPFLPMQYARLLILRGRFRAGEVSEDVK